MKIFDTHTHDYFSDFDEERKEMLFRCERIGVAGKIQIGCDVSSSQKALELAKENKNMWATLGVHPCSVQNVSEDPFPFFSQILTENPIKIVGVGETGFDFFHQDTPELRSLQEQSFSQHFDFALEHDLSLVVHTRKARNETLHFLVQKKKIGKMPKGVIHCFSEDLEFAKVMTEEFGFFLGIGGILTYPKNDALRSTIRQIPISFLVTETDAPYLAPQRNRGKKNESSYLTEVIECIADEKQIHPEECAEILFENAQRLFPKAQDAYVIK
jgi:TatD DNase family protein